MISIKSGVSGWAVTADRSATGLRPWVHKLWIGLFILRAIALCTGLDRLPLLPTVEDETFINDPALALSRGYGLVAFSLAHSSLGLDQVFANYPPVFIFVQAFVFRVFGFSAITLRASSVAFDLTACAVFLVILRELHSRGVADEVAAAFGGILLLLEPSTLIHSRQGRMESLVILLGALGFYLALLASRRGNQDTRMWFAAATAMGFALSTHLAAVVTCVGLSGWSILHYRQLGLKRWLAVNALAPLILLSVWMVTYRAKAGVAFRQTRQIASTLSADSQTGTVLDAVRQGTASGNQIALAVTVSTVVFILVFSVWRVFAARNDRDSPGEWWQSLACLCGVLLGQCALLQFVVPSSGLNNRQVLVIPLTLVCLAVALSHAGNRARRRVIAVFLFVAALQVSAISGYLGQLRHHWRDRSPERFDDVLTGIPVNARVVAVPEFWFALRSHGRSFAMKYVENSYWNEVPDAFERYDVVILDVDDSDPALIERARIGKPLERLIRTYPNRTFLLLAKPFDGLPVATGREGLHINLGNW